MKYRKKPVIVDAVQWNKPGDHPMVLPMPKDAWWDAGLKHPDEAEKYGFIWTLEGGHLVTPGDWIITGVKGEHYPCKPDIFEATYERVEDESAQPGCDVIYYCEGRR